MSEGNGPKPLFWIIMAVLVVVLGYLGLTRLQNPTETLPRVITAIRAEPDSERQLLLLRQLIDLLPDKELVAMTEQLLTNEDIEELKRFPALWRDYQRQQQEARLEQTRDDILEALVTRFDPSASDYLSTQRALTDIDNADRLRVLFRQALLAADFATFVRELSGANAST